MLRETHVVPSRKSDCRLNRSRVELRVVGKPLSVKILFCLFFALSWKEGLFETFHSLFFLYTHTYTPERKKKQNIERRDLRRILDKGRNTSLGLRSERALESQIFL